MAKKQSDSLVKNASVLMIATIVSRIIGLIYRSPLGAILGSVGLGYYGYASNLYTILLLISSYSIPMAVSKIVSAELARKRYRNAWKMFQGALIYALIVGGATALICWFFGGYLLPQNQQNALPALKALAPTIFLSAILGVLRGFFQAHRTMTPTSVSQILEQIMNAVVSILAAWILVSSQAGNEEGQAIYGAMGGTIGTGAGVLVGLIFMTWVFFLNRRYFQRKVAQDVSGEEESYGDILREMLQLITPIIFTSFILNCSSYLDSYMYSTIQGINGFKDTAISAAYGEYSNYYVPLVSIPLAIASASTSAMMPEVSGLHATGNYSEANYKVNETMRISMFICIPCMIGLTVLAHPIVSVLFPAASDLAGNLLLTGSIFVVTDSFSIISGGVLQSIGHQTTALINSAISLGVNLASLAIILLIRPELDIYAVMIANIIFSVVCCALNVVSMRKYLGLRHQIRSTYVEPFIASAIMGVVAFVVYRGILALTSRPSISLIVAIVLAIFVYLVAYVKISKISPEELSTVPGGTRIVSFLRKIRVYN
ncbi:MAG: polysaccharide biosynthesis protein [Eubacteriales bacterium]|jgi:stage V sporulation protein B